MPWRFQISDLKKAWVPTSLYALFIPILTLSRSSVTEGEGWAMPTAEKPMIIGVPGWTFSDQFVNVEQSTKNPDEKIYSGFCILAFEEVVKTLSPNYYLHHKYVVFNGSYDDMVNCVANGTFDAAVGDITILADRWRVVEFTVPFTETGMSLVVPVKAHPPNGWMFLTPFTMELWVATWAILMYTMFIVWLLERRSNSEFRGPWKDQLANVLWFTFSSLFSTHREIIQRNYTRVVVVVWLFVVLIVTQSYTANLSSMLTVSKLDPNVDSLKKGNAVVGFYGNNVVKEYLVNVLHFKEENIRYVIATQSHYLDALRNGSMSAAFIEAHYAKVIVNQYCDQLTVTGPTYKLGGLGFVFQKGSPVADDVSEAILCLLEDGTIKKLEDECFTPSSDCSNFQTTKNNGSLRLHDFWGLYTFYVATCTICLLLFIIHSLNNLRHRQQVQEGNITLARASVRNKILRLTRFFNNADSREPGRALTSGHGPIDVEMHQTPGSVV